MPDTDDDGLYDHQEKRFGADPRVSDTDGDLVPDGQDADPLWDLGVAIANMTAETTNGSSVIVTFALAGDLLQVRPPQSGAARLDVTDVSPSRESHEVAVVVGAEDAQTGEGLALFPDARGVILTFDLLRGTVAGADQQGRALSFEGTDGSLRFDWATSRT